MLALFDFIAHPESATTFMKDFASGKINMNWKEILAEDEQRINFHELTMMFILQAANNALSFDSEKLAPLIGKLLILNQQIDAVASSDDTATLSDLCKKFEDIVRQITQIIDTAAVVETLNSLQDEEDVDIFSSDVSSEYPLFALIFALRMLVYAHEFEGFADEGEDEEGDIECVSLECEDECS